MTETVVRSINPRATRESDLPNVHHEDRVRIIVDEHARALVLRVLYNTPEYRMNSRVLHRIIDHWALSFAHAELVAQLEWLDREGLIALRPVEDAVVATLRSKGADTALGRTVHEGVERPLPVP